MISIGIFQTTEFYVILAIIAAFIVGFCAMPSSRGEARLYMLSGETGVEEPGHDPWIEFLCLDDGNMVLTRHGIEGVSSSGAVSIAVNITGFDVVIEERLTPGRLYDGPVNMAVFNLGFLSPEWYHVLYNSGTTGLSAAVTLHVRPGLKVTRGLVL